MTPNESLAPIRAKIERAKKHIGELDASCRAFSDAQERLIQFNLNPQTGDRTYYLAEAREVPAEIPAIAGDALHNLRASLDYLACQLVRANGKRPTRNTCFPIYNNPEDYKSKWAQKNTEGMRPDAIDAIHAFKPYRGGHDPLWRLHMLDIIDKHRLLITTCLVNISHSMTRNQREEIVRRSGGSLSNPRGMRLASPIRHLPLKAGMELRTVPESEVEGSMKFDFAIAFNEPEIIPERIRVVAILGPMADIVVDIVSRFGPLLA